MIDPRAVEDAVWNGDAEGVRHLLYCATEKERRACARELAAFLAEPGGRTSSDIAVLAANVGLATGVAGASRALDSLTRADELPAGTYDLIAGVLADRSPSWLASLIDRGLSARAGWGSHAWQLARRLVRQGVIGRPAVDEYTRAMISSVHSLSPPYVFRSPLGMLLGDPGLLEDEIWRVFEVPDAGRWMEQPRGSWSKAFCELAARGLLDRGRLLDACLDAFVRDFPEGTVGWYAELHDRLAPTAAEARERSARYLALLACGSKAGITLGQRHCQGMLQAGALDGTAFLAASPPALAHLRKSVAIAQLKLIGKLAALQPDAREAALATAAQAFTHQREDVQAAALTLIAWHGLPAAGAARDTITELAVFLSPVLRPEAAALGLAPDQGPGAAPEAPAAPVDAGASPSASPVVPVTDPAELVRLLARLLEDARDALAVERALDGAVRLSALPLPDRARLAGPLLKRARQLVAADNHFGPFTGCWPGADLASLVLTWATGEMPAGVNEPHGDTRRLLSGILSARVWEACGLIAGGHGLPLLATPEFPDGSIGHRELLARLARWARRAPGEWDLDQALLRLAPVADDTFWGRLGGQQAERARWVHEESLTPIDFEVLADGPHLPCILARSVTPVTAPASRCWELLTSLLAAGAGLDTRLRWICADVQVVATWPLLCPNNPELVAAHLLTALSEDLRESGSAAALMALHGIAAPGRPFGRVGHLAMVTGMASAEPATRIAAAAVWARTAADGRLRPDLATLAMTEGITGHAFRLARLADGLERAAMDATSGTLVAQAGLATAAALLSTSPRPPGGLHLLLEAVARVSAAVGLPPVPPAITSLAAGQPKTKLAQAARRLTAL
jgi:hypothetical protein